MRAGEQPEPPRHSGAPHATGADDRDAAGSYFGSMWLPQSRQSMHGNAISVEPADGGGGGAVWGVVPSPHEDTGVRREGELYNAPVSVMTVKRLGGVPTYTSA